MRGYGTESRRSWMRCVKTSESCIVCFLTLIALHVSAQIEELSNQNEDLIDKLKESMERELILR